MSIYLMTKTCIFISAFFKNALGEKLPLNIDSVGVGSWNKDVNGGKFLKNYIAGGSIVGDERVRKK